MPDIAVTRTCIC